MGHSPGNFCGYLARLEAVSPLLENPRGRTQDIRDAPEGERGFAACARDLRLEYLAFLLEQKRDCSQSSGYQNGNFIFKMKAER